MPLIDSRGRLFGKVNIIDILIIVGMIVSIIIASKLILDKSEVISKTDRTLIVYAVQENVEPAYADSVYIGEQLIRDDVILVEILDKRTEDIAWNYKQNMFLTMRIKATEDNAGLYINDKPIRIGGTVPIDTKDHALRMKIINIYNSQEELNNINSDFVKKSITVSLFSMQVLESVADSLYSGKFIKQNNETTGKILSKEILGESVTAGIIRQQDLLVQMQLNVQLKENKIYFNEKEIKKGSSIIIPIESHNIEFAIMGIGNQNIFEKEEIELTLYMPQLDKMTSSSIRHAKKTENNTDASIIAIEEKPSQVSAYDREKRVMIVSEDPLRKDLTVKVRLTAYEDEGIYFYQSERLAVGKEISLDIGQTNIQGKIVSIN